jgi:DHA1 family bicyclomycin/chloramphenicol resistance-like MFS transporter
MQYIVGALAAPLVGIAGPHSALPMALVIATAGSGAGLAFVGLTRPSIRVLS